MNISDNKVVSVLYTLRLDDKFGEIVEMVKEDVPLVYIQASGIMLDAFEKNIEGLKAGDRFDFKIPCEDAYGEFRKDAIITVDKEFFKVDGQIDKSVLKKGNVIELQDENKMPIHGEITEIKGPKVMIDINHPLAGEDLFFDGKILDVREATAEEIEQGDIDTF